MNSSSAMLIALAGGILITIAGGTIYAFSNNSENTEPPYATKETTEINQKEQDEWAAQPENYPLGEQNTATGGKRKSKKRKLSFNRSNRK